jgi:sensor c-di-GMP phosphodiesterase-like protein
MTLASTELNAIRDGLNKGEFFIEYLPIVCLGDQTCLGAEALIRWRRPDGAVVLPAGFIPQAENTPLSGLITYWLIDTLAVEVGGWLRTHPEAHLSLNVPPEILGRGGLEYAAGKSGLGEFRSQLILEVTERGIPDRLGLMALNSMHRGGIQLALDDVTMSGTNLALISRCDFHIIKLDRLLTAQVTAECPHPDWLRSLADSCRPAIWSSSPKASKPTPSCRRCAPPACNGVRGTTSRRRWPSATSSPGTREPEKPAPGSADPLPPMV